MNDVTIGSVWMHRNGIKYTVYDFTNLDSMNPKYPPMVSYIGQNGKTWSRRLDDWHRSMTFVSK